MKFENWFSSKVTIGAFPYKVNVKFAPALYRYIINVSDEHYDELMVPAYRRGAFYFWFPMSEFKKDMGLNSIFGAIVILMQAEHEDETVYLHCHSGQNRSWTVAAAYYYFRTGTHLDKTTRTGFLNKLISNCHHGNLPPVKEMEAFLSAIRNELNDKMMPGILSLAKVNTIKNF